MVTQQHPRRWRLALATIAGVGASLWYLSARGVEADPAPRAEPAQQAAGSDELARMRGELDRMRAHVERSERRIAELETTAPAARDPESDEAVATAAEGAKAEASDDDQRRQVARAFEAEGEDASWNPDGEIRTVFEAVLPEGSAIRGIACRSTLCRVDTDHPDQAAQQALASALAIPRFDLPRPFKGALFTPAELGADGRQLHAVTYLVRSGHSFPAVQ